MNKSAVYFFAEYPIEFAMWAGLADIIREVRPDIPLVLVYAREIRSSGYDWDFILKRFDHVLEITRISWAGNWRAGITGRNIMRTLFKGFPAARRVASELRAISFQPNSVAFVLNGLSLNQMLFLKRVKSEAGMVSVLITKQTDDALLNDYFLNYNQSFYLNLYSHFFGTAYMDIYWLRTEGSRTGQRDLKFRTKPASYVFEGIHAPKYLSLNPGQVFFPLYIKDRALSRNTESVVLFGQIFEWEPNHDADLCYKRLNELIDIIRRRHPNSRLIYKPHPGQTEQQRAKVDLKGFEVVSSVSSEALVMKDHSISTAYTFNSTSVFTSACLGIKSYYLYPLFDSSCIPTTLMRRYENCWYSEPHPEICIGSIDDWINGKNEYNPANISERIRASSIKMLEVVGVIDTTDAKGLSTDISVTPEERWSNGVHPWPFRRLGRLVI